MSSLRTLARFPSVLVVLIALTSSRSALAQQAVYGDSDSLRGIEEQAKRRAKAEASANATAAIYAKQTADVNRINAESAKQWETLYSAYRQLYLRHKTGLVQNSNLPAYLQGQFFELVRLDMQRFDAEVQSLKDFNRAQVEYATLTNQRQNLQQLRDGKNHEAAARQAKLIENGAATYNSSLDRLKASRANASRLNETRESLVRSYNKSFVAWKDVSNSVSGGGSSSGSSGGSSGDDYDLAGALRDRLRDLNSGYGH
jgi:predicted nuclease with TOPRIM domain